MCQHRDTVNSFQLSFIIIIVIIISLLTYNIEMASSSSSSPTSSPSKSPNIQPLLTALQVKKENTVVMESLPESKLDDYIAGIKKYISEKDIRHVGRITLKKNEVVAMYLASKEVADSVIEKEIYVNERIVTVIPLVFLTDV